jgi:hypothetical protein
MATIRLKPFTTNLTAQGTVGGILKMTSTSGITRHACLSIDSGSAGWRVQVIRVVDSITVIARMTGFQAVSGTQPNQGNPNDLTPITNGSVVILEEQWVPDLYQDDVPTDLAIPVK